MQHPRQFYYVTILCRLLTSYMTKLSSHFILYLKLPGRTLPRILFVLTFDVCCHCYCTVMLLLLAPCLSRFTLKIKKCVIIDSSSLEKKYGKYSTFTLLNAAACKHQ